MTGFAANTELFNNPSSSFSPTPPPPTNITVKNRLKPDILRVFLDIFGFERSRPLSGRLNIISFLKDIVNRIGKERLVLD